MHGWNEWTGWMDGMDGWMDGWDGIEALMDAWMDHLEEHKKAVQVVDAALADRGPRDTPPATGKKTKR